MISKWQVPCCSMSSISFMIAAGLLVLMTASRTATRCFLFFFNSFFRDSFLHWSVGFINFPVFVVFVDRLPIFLVHAQPRTQLQPYSNTSCAQDGWSSAAQKWDWREIKTGTTLTQKATKIINVIQDEENLARFTESLKRSNELSKNMVCVCVCVVGHHCEPDVVQKYMHIKLLKSYDLVFS